MVSLLFCLSDSLSPRLTHGRRPNTANSPRLTEPSERSRGEEQRGGGEEEEEESREERQKEERSRVDGG